MPVEFLLMLAQMNPLLLCKEMFIADPADKTSACRANETLSCDVRHAAGFAGFFLRGLALTALRGVAGRIAIGPPAALAETSSGSGPDLNCARHGGESCDLFLIMQAVMRSTSGMSEPHRRNASPVQACCCSAV
jgi:hypothetical protein